MEDEYIFTATEGKDGGTKIVFKGISEYFFRLNKLYKQKRFLKNKSAKYHENLLM